MTRPLNVQVISTDPATDPRCGIAAHTHFLIDHGTPSGVRFLIDSRGLDPQVCVPLTDPLDVLHLNYHRGLHSRWTPKVLRDWRREYPKVRVVVTFHDTYAAPQPDTLAAELATEADALIIHEPAEDLLRLGSHVCYWRQGVPQRASDRDEPDLMPDLPPLVLGTIGHDFPWKQYDLLAEATAMAGWGLLIVGGMTTERKQALQRVNPSAWILDLPNAEDALGVLRQYCAATAFLYQCANSGTSAAIRYGLAAGKPLFATDGCRQFRDLQESPGAAAISWLGEGARNARAFANVLACQGFSGPHVWDSQILSLAWRDRWDVHAQLYTDLYRQLAVSGTRRS